LHFSALAELSEPENNFRHSALVLELGSKGHKKFLETDKDYYDGIFLYSGTRGEVPQVSGILERRNEAPLEHHEMNSNKDPCLNPKISIRNSNRKEKV